MDWNITALKPLLFSVGILGSAILLGLLLHWLIFKILGGLASRTKTATDDLILDALRPPTKLLLPWVLIGIIDSWLAFPEPVLAVLRRLITLVLIAAVTWACMRLLRVAETSLVEHQRQKVNEAELRQIATQLTILRRVLTGIAIILGAALMLLTFPRVRAVGASLLASAGLMALVAGVAVRPALSNLIAGIQIALSRSIHIGDVVVVNGEWGHIEEISLTVVVVRTWDLRRIVFPISQFTEKPFENWTRTSSQIIGSVILYTDYRVPVAEIRNELQRIVRSSPHWDGEIWALVVVDTTEHALKLRATMSAKDPSSAWNLRCEVRERLVDFLQREYPECLPRLRTEQGPISLEPPRWSARSTKEDNPS